jgi:hydroxyacylglutathione hydrolase
VIDVRQTSEFESGHVPGSWHLMAGWLPDRLSQLPRDRPLATICASGYRASIAASLLQRAGFGDVVRVEDGVVAWEAAGYPIERGAR